MEVFRERRLVCVELRELCGCVCREESVPHMHGQHKKQHCIDTLQFFMFLFKRPCVYEKHENCVRTQRVYITHKKYVWKFSPPFKIYFFFLFCCPASLLIIQSFSFTHFYSVRLDNYHFYLNSNLIRH